MSETERERPKHFIQHIIDHDIATGTCVDGVVTRFPPEPNGFLHIGHAKSICLNFGIAELYPGGVCHLRFDDTNPAKEEAVYVDAIERDVAWLGYQWHGPVRYASAYFPQLYALAEQLIEQGCAYVDESTAEQIRAHRGTLTEPGTDSPYRDRPVAESLERFRQMRDGAFEDGQMVLRAKIDMASPNLNLRDPVMYRIRRAKHHQTGEQWCIYPMYDYAHCVSDAIEGITHSLCTLEFEDHRPLYDWYLDHLDVRCHPQQIEFARLELQYTVTSKRRLQQLVDEGLVQGWDDPRMPTLAGLRRRGYTPSAIRLFCDRIGVSKANNSVEMELLESSVRDDLDPRAPRRMAVLDPLKVVLTNFPEGQVEPLSAPNHPQHEALGSRTVPLTRELYIERDDFRESANKKFKRLVAGGEVRLRYGHVIRCNEVVKDPASGKVTELRCTYDPNTLGRAPEGRNVKGVIHWVSAAAGLRAEFRLYDRLFTVANPAAEADFRAALNPDSLRICHGFVEPELGKAGARDSYQFERTGYFCLDADSVSAGLVFNRTVGLRDSWVKVERKLEAAG